MNTILVEDNPSQALDIEIMLKKLNLTIIGVADSEKKALSLIKVHHSNTELIIIDIFLKGEETGIDLYNKIVNLEIPTLFLTAYNEQYWYERVRNIGKAPYLVKPFDILSLQSAIDQATLLQASLKGKCYYIKHGSEYQQLYIAEIIYLESDHNYTNIYTSQIRYVVRKSLTKLLEELQDEELILINRKNAVRLACIEKISFTNHYLELGEKRFSISKAYLKSIREKLNLMS